ncbi:phage tail tube protein [Salmonella enterica]|nr:phage tail protein [Salmonella enterica]EKC4347153.1 phage tail tube protein [Salmonella enterica subsp. enterica]EHO0432337.1 phage tail tube protein [Salmonella enterica]EJX2579989.1 phage tail tube protein [Salmonella enterica]EKC4939497.1 phage tail tube protein [Salmonella enterica]
MSGSPLRRQGSAIIRVNGSEIETLAGSTFTPSGMQKETVKGSSVYGWKGTPHEATLECKIVAGGTVSVADIVNWDNLTIEFRSDVGEVHLMPNAWMTDVPTNSDSGEISVKFAAKKSKRIA